MRVLIVVPQQDRVSGNWVTALRFRQGLQRLGCDVVIHETALDGAQSLAEQTTEFQAEVALLLHAYRTGRPWLESRLSLPYVTMLTGTDQNLGLQDPQQRDLIVKVLRETACITLQNPILARNLAEGFPAFANKIRIIPPGTTLGNASYDLYATHHLPKEPPLLLLPAGLRPVKGVLELIEMLGQHAKGDPQFQLAVCGPILDVTYGERCLAVIAGKNWAHYLGAIPSDAMASVIRQADVIVNNSFAEGLSNSLLEAVSLGRPILARNIPGNAVIVEPGVNGFLYDNFAEFSACLTELLKDDVRKQLSHPAPEKFDPHVEARTLYEALQLATRKQ